MHLTVLLSLSGEDRRSLIITSSVRNKRGQTPEKYVGVRGLLQTCNIKGPRMDTMVMSLKPSGKNSF